MPTIADICHSDSHLSDVQIHILEKSEPFLQFAADLAQRRLALFRTVMPRGISRVGSGA